MKMSGCEIRWKRVLWNKERGILASFVEVLIPFRDGMGTPKMERVLDLAEKQLWCMPWDKRVLFRACLWIFELSAFFYKGRFQLMSRMDFDLRTRYLNAWHATWWSLKRLIKRFVEVVVFMNYYTLRETTDSIGYMPKYEAPSSSPDFPTNNLIRDFPAANVELSCDVCVVGAGAGGAVVAKELAEKGHSVVILEEGPWFDVDEFGKDTMDATTKLYRDAGAMSTVGWPFIPVFLGRCVGGTTLVNSGTCFRTPDHVLNGWVEDYGLSGWDPENLEPYFDRVERIIGVEQAREDIQGPSAKFLRPGITSLGHELKPLNRNAPGCRGSGICVQGCPTNGKKSVQLNYIPLAMQAGAKVYAQVKVQRIRCRKQHVDLVEGQFRNPRTREIGPRLRLNAKVVVTCAGTLHTPILLSRSGIPNPSGQRGKNLSLHPATKVYALFDREVRGWEGIPQGYYCDALADEGIKFEGVFISPSYAASTILLTGEQHKAMMDRYKNIACFGFMVSDSTRGRVFTGAGGQPYAWYNLSRRDLPKFKRGYEFLADAFFAAGAKKVLPGIYTLPVISSEQGSAAIKELRLRNKDLDLQAFHPLGTCRMGADPRRAVVDGWGRVYGLDNLFIADGSILPTSLGVNPMVTIMAAATKIADNIHRDNM